MISSKAHAETDSWLRSCKYFLWKSGQNQCRIVLLSRMCLTMLQLSLLEIPKELVGVQCSAI